ncbi:hypothetical protein ACTUM2_14810, partial [Listeria monocytogenes]|uniref:hypothetical protein n=1 Tax=Listeria monocytogenes TaxID=1639 RepID=UPI003FA4C1DC
KNIDKFVSPEMKETFANSLRYKIARAINEPNLEIITEFLTHNNNYHSNRILSKILLEIFEKNSPELPSLQFDSGFISRLFDFGKNIN